jgi:hypothetical protein
MAVDFALSSNIANFLFAVLIATVISVFCTMSLSSKNALNSLIAEYSVMEGVVLLLTVMTILNIKSSGASLFTFSSFITLFPFLLILFIIGIFIALLSIYFDRIANNKVSSYYTSFSGTSVTLIIAQIMLLVNSIAKTPTNPVLNKKTFSILMLLGTINLIVVITLGVVLKFYSTDC